MIYLDNAATTQIDHRVKEAMLPFLTKQFGNPGSLYKLGRDAKAAVEKAREQVAKFMGAKPEQIIFTSGATEANNMVFEITRPHLVSIGKTHILTSQIEHKSVLRSVRRVIDECGVEATFAGLSRTFSRSEWKRLAIITLLCFLNCSRSLTTRLPKKVSPFFKEGS